MTKSGKRLLFIDALLLPVIPLLYLYNQNMQYLSIRQILIAIFALIVFQAAFYGIIIVRFHSELTAFISCLANIVLVFSYNELYYDITDYIKLSYILLILIPLISYLFSCIFFNIVKQKSYKNAPYLISVVLAVMLVMNTADTVMLLWPVSTDNVGSDFKTEFISDNDLPTPNVYWILCDGMLGFDAFEQYYGDAQDELASELTERGFEINRSAMLESGHVTRIAVPALMCPEFYDNYLADILSNHETAMELRKSSNANLFSSRYYNETINAFDNRGYTTITMALDEFDIFFPTTDYFYYLASHFTSDAKFAELPYYVMKSDINDPSYFQRRFYSQYLGYVFLGGFPIHIFDYLYGENVTHHMLSSSTDRSTDILLTGSLEARRYSVLINSLYDTLYEKDINGPKFVIVHDLMAHCPICFDEQGNLVDNIDTFSAYAEHHRYAANVLLEIVDLILEADPDAVIILQADHGLHTATEEAIIKAFGSTDAVLDIWNNVFCAIRIPDQFQAEDEQYVMENPLNISRYLINSYVGPNYSYITE